MLRCRQALACEPDCRTVGTRLINRQMQELPFWINSIASVCVMFCVLWPLISIIWSPTCFTQPEMKSGRKKKFQLDKKFWRRKRTVRRVNVVFKSTEKLSHFLFLVLARNGFNSLHSDKPNWRNDFPWSTTMHLNNSQTRSISQVFIWAWVKLLCSTRHIIDHFRYIVLNQSISIAV